MSWSRLAEHRRQRGVVLLADLDRAGEAGSRQPADVVEHRVDVDRLALDRPLVGEHLHAVDQLHDAVGLVADQPGERAVVVVDAGFEQLGGAADAGQRVLDLVGEHRGEAGDGARGAAMGELAVDLVGHRALLQHDDDAARLFEAGRGVDVDDALGAVARRADVDAVFVDRRAALAHLLDQRQQRAAEGHEIGERVPAEHVGRGLEEGLGRRVGLGDACRRRRPADGMRQRVEQRRCRTAAVDDALASFMPPSVPGRRRTRRPDGAARRPGGSAVSTARRQRRVAGRRLLHVPAEMLAGDAHAEKRAVVVEQRLVVPHGDVGERRLVGQRTGRRRRCATMARQPRPAVGAAADHDAVGAGQRQHRRDVVETGGIAIGDHRDRHRLLDRADRRPVGPALVELAARAAVHGDHPHAGAPRRRRASSGALIELWSQPSRIFSVTGSGVAATVASIRVQRMVEVAHQRRAGIAGRHLARRAAHVDVDDVGAGVGRRPRAFRHPVRLAPGELDDVRPVARALGAHGRFGRACGKLVAGHHLGDHQAGAEFGRQRAERPIGDARHRREEDPVGDHDRPDRQRFCETLHSIRLLIRQLAELPTS